MKKHHRTAFQSAWNQKNKHYRWKNNSASKNPYKFISKKGHRTVFQNAWSQKNQHSH